MYTRTVPAAVVVLDRLREGRWARVSALLGSGECQQTRRLGLRPGEIVCCRERTSDGIRFDTTDGRVVFVPWACAAYVQVERISVPGPGALSGGVRLPRSA